jgi:heme/copper-type cytochrome/quinol oxidase subunit 1
MFAMINEFGNQFVPIFIGAPNIIFSQLKNINFELCTIK